MSVRKINEQVLKKIRIMTIGKEDLLAFIEDLLLEESGKYNDWRWKESYKRIVAKHIKGDDEK